MLYMFCIYFQIFYASNITLHIIKNNIHITSLENFISKFVIKLKDC